MKKLIPLTFLMLLGVLGLNAQNLQIDFTAIDNSYQEAKELKSQFHGSNTLIVEQSNALATTQIAEALKGKQIIDLHIYVSTKPGALGFGNMTLNPETLQEHSAVLSKLASNVTGKVIIHSNDVFTTKRGLDFKARLEQITGLSFVMQ